MKDNKFWTMIAGKPACILLLGACPALAAAANLKAGLSVGLLGLALLLVLTVLAMALKGLIAPGFRLPVFAILAVAVCGAARMELHALFPETYGSLSIYLTLLALAVAFFAVAQTEAEISFGCAVGNAVKAGILFLLAVAATAAVCELLGSGSICGNEVAGLSGMKNAVLVQPAGRILVYGFAVAVFGGLFCGKKEEA